METPEIMENPTTITLPSANQVVTVWFEVRNRLKITVLPDKTVEVRAPADRTLEEVRAKLEKRAVWIAQQVEYFDQYHPLIPERQYVSGETYYYLGRQHRLKVVPGRIDAVKKMDLYFVLTTTRPEDRERKKKLLQDWYTRHARKLIRDRFLQYVERVEGLAAKKPEVKFRKMSKRWGSCTPSGVITFNTELIKAPIHCIDYVVLHELCHLVHPGHSEKFYHLLDVLMPDWRMRKERLEKVILM